MTQFAQAPLTSKGVKGIVVGYDRSASENLDRTKGTGVQRYLGVRNSNKALTKESQSDLGERALSQLPLGGFKRERKRGETNEKRKSTRRRGLNQVRNRVSFWGDVR